MPVKHGTAQTAYDEGRRMGIVVGLEMAAKYVSMCKDTDEAAMMIKAALLTINQNQQT